MKNTMLWLSVITLASSALAQNCPVVDFGDNLFWYAVGIPPYRAGIPGAKTPERIKLAEGEFINGQPFSMDIPLNMMTADYNRKGNNTRFYGGMKTHVWDNPLNKYAWSEGGCNVDHEGYDDLNFMADALVSLHTPEKPGCRETAIGVWMWKKEDFLNGGNKYPVTFDENSRVGVYLSRTYAVNNEHRDRLVAEGKIPAGAGPFTDTYANQQTNIVPREYWRGWESVHLVVQDGDPSTGSGQGQFYVAETAFEPYQQTLFEVYPARVKWTKYNPQGPWDFEFNHKTATFEPHEFKDVRAAGWMICKNVAENSTLWCKWYAFGMDAVVNRPAEQQVAGWNLPMRKVGSLYVAATEVSYEQWRRVWKWGQRNQFSLHRSFAFDRDGNLGSMLADDREHTQKEPVTGIAWHDAVVWCNALSAYEGRTPCYYTDAAYTNVLRVARDGLDIAKSLVPPVVYVNMEADGYRLPTATEWSTLAAGAQAGTKGEGTQPAASGEPTDLGLYDVLGNVWEYIWDREGVGCDMTADPSRTVLGGDYRASPETSALPSGEMPSRGHYAIGFRPVRGKGTTGKIAATGLPTWIFKAEQVIPPAKEVDAAELAPAIEMINLTGFAGGKTEVSYAQWRQVFQWAEVHGYHFSWDGDMGSMAWDSEPAPHSPSEPVTGVGVLDAAIWCNALSELSGLKPCYYRDAAKTEVLRLADPFRVIGYQWANGSSRDGGKHKILPKFQFYRDEAANGFRLPMTEEWTAMSGDAAYPSGATLDPETAWYAANSVDRTHPVGTRKPTGAGFHDLSGNVFEWAIATAKEIDPKRGQFFDLEARGGSFRSDDTLPKTLGRTPMRGAWNWISNGTAVPELGFRVVRTSTIKSPMN